MASAISKPPYLSHPSSSSSLSPTLLRNFQIHASLSISQMSSSKSPSTRSLTWVPRLCLTPFSSWNGLRKNGFSVSLQSIKSEKRENCKGKGVFASLFGVGAPEALVIGVVALLVFGPKGLAEVAKNLGKTLREFQPTIRELQEVSREFKTTLEKEIGLDELKNPVQGSYSSTTAIPPDTRQNSQLTVETPAVSTVDSRESTPTPAITNEDSQPTADTANESPSSKAYSSEDILRITEEQMKESASQQQKEQPNSEI